jgi:hypothetical protein
MARGGAASGSPIMTDVTIQHSRSARAKALAARTSARRARRRRLLTAAAPIAVVAVVVAVLVGVKLGNGSDARSGAPAAAANETVVRAVTAVPASALDAVGIGSATRALTAVTGPALAAGGKPRILYIGAEYCPFCAAQRWPLIVALSRFGTWTGLGQTTSAGAPEVYPNTPTFSFHGAGYTSELLAFTGVETESNQVRDGRYAPLDTPAGEDVTQLRRHDPEGSIPYLDLGGRWISVGASYRVEVLAGKTHQQIATALSEPSSPIARAVDGAANMLTAGLCQLTGGAPTQVCTAPGVTAAASMVGRAG